MALADIYYGIGVDIDETSQDSAYMHQPPVETTVTYAGTTVDAHLTLGDPSAGAPLTLQFNVSGGNTPATEGRFGTVQAPIDPSGAPLEWAPILLYLAGTGTTPIGALVSVRLTTTFVADEYLQADSVQVVVNDVRYRVGAPAASIALQIGSLVYVRVFGDNERVTPNHRSSLGVSLVPTLTTGS